MRRWSWSNCSLDTYLFVADCCATGDFLVVSRDPGGVVLLAGRSSRPCCNWARHWSRRAATGSSSRAYMMRGAQDRLHRRVRQPSRCSWRRRPRRQALRRARRRVDESTHSESPSAFNAFAVNTVTGVWNMWESCRHPNAGRKRSIHGSGTLVPRQSWRPECSHPTMRAAERNRSTYRNVVIASTAVVAGHLIDADRKIAMVLLVTVHAAETGRRSMEPCGAAQWRGVLGHFAGLMAVAACGRGRSRNPAGRSPSRRRARRPRRAARATSRHCWLRDLRQRDLTVVLISKR